MYLFKHLKINKEVLAYKSPLSKTLQYLLSTYHWLST